MLHAHVTGQQKELKIDRRGLRDSPSCAIAATPYRSTKCPTRVSQAALPRRASKGPPPTATCWEYGTWSGSPHDLVKWRHLKEQFQFSSESSLAGYSRALTAAIRSKSLHRSVESQGFQNFLEFIRSTLLNGTGEDRLLAVALACKVTISAKGTRPKIERIFEGAALGSPLPPLKALSDPDDRYYAANVWRFASRGWITHFLALGALEEESAENTRRECTEGLLALSSGIGKALKTLESTLPALHFLPETPHSNPGSNKKRSVPGDGMSRRMRRVLAAINQSVILGNSLPEEEVGPSLRSLIRKAFEISGLPKDLPAKLDLANEVLNLILLFARSRYALALLADTYSPIVTMRDWFTAAEWSDLTDKDVAKTLAGSIQASIELLARTGAVDNSLFDLLVLTSGNAETARLLTHQIIERGPGLPPEIVAWLSGQPIRKSTTLSSESQMVRIEEAIADIMIANQSVSKASKSVEVDFVPQLSIYQSIPLALLRDFLSTYSGLGITIDALCEMRGLELLESQKVAEEFSPLRHEFMNPSDFGVRTVKIVQPGVIARRDDGTVRIIRKALVIPA